jgi:hypothetical protein
MTELGRGGWSDSHQWVERFAPVGGAIRTTRLQTPGGRRTARQSTNMSDIPAKQWLLIQAAGIREGISA